MAISEGKHGWAWATSLHPCVLDRGCHSVVTQQVVSNDPKHWAIVEHLQWNHHSLPLEAENNIYEMQLSMKLEREEIREMGYKKLISVISHT